MCQNKDKLIYTVGALLSLLLLALTIFTGISAQNKIKEGKYIGQDIESENNITVSGEGKVYAQPDLGVINFSVVTEKETVQDAISSNKEKMNKVIKEVKNQGVKEKDIKTIRFDVHPRYEWHEEEKSYKTTQGKRVLVGYEVNQKLRVKIRDLNKVGEVIQRATRAGANSVGNIQFTIEDKQEFKKQARKKAITEAKEKADRISSQLGVDLVKIVNFSENFYAPRPYTPAMKEAQQAVGQGGGAPDIEAGQNKIEANVSVTYSID